MSYVVPHGARMEVKFEADESRMHDILHWLRLHRCRFSEAYPMRGINNIYFDSPDYLAIADNFSGTSSRTKVRVRWYGDEHDAVAGALELKRKRNGFGWKLRYDLKVPERQHGTSWRDFRAAIASQLPSEGQHWLAISSQPTMLNVYRRRYYLSGDRRVRITIDTDQNVWDQRVKPSLNLHHPANLPRLMIVEVKFDRRDRHLASQVVQGMPIRVSRHSKYLTAANAIRF